MYCSYKILFPVMFKPHNFSQMLLIPCGDSEHIAFSRGIWHLDLRVRSSKDENGGKGMKRERGGLKRKPLKCLTWGWGDDLRVLQT